MVDQTEDNYDDAKPNDQILQNPLLNKLSKEQFKASVRFYEADHQLTSQERQEIAQDLKNVVFKIGIGSYSIATIGLTLPTMYQKFYIGGPVKNFMHKPFMSFLFGLGSMVLGNELGSRYFYNQQLHNIEAKSHNQLQVWKAMERHQLSLFYLYYLRSSKDESFILKDPRTFNPKTDSHQVHYNPPVKQPNPKPMIGRQDTDSPSTNGDSDSQEMSQWEQIRIANGFGPK